MTSLLLAEVNKLKSAENSLEKSEGLVCFLQKYGEKHNLTEYFLELEENRQLDLEKNRSELELIFKSLDVNKKLLQNLNGHDLKTFKKDMIVLQESIQSLKMRLHSEKEILQDQQKELADELEPFNRKIEEWKKAVTSSSKTDYKIKQNLVSSSTSQKKVKQFMDFVNENNGHENGWTSEDHQLFLKTRKKYRNTDSIVLNLHKLLPDLDQEEIRSHDIWYTQYLLLKKQMKEALCHWRESKQKVCPQEETQVDCTVTNNKKSDCATLEDVKEKLAVWKNHATALTTLIKFY